MQDVIDLFNDILGYGFIVAENRLTAVIKWSKLNYKVDRIYHGEVLAGAIVYHTVNPWEPPEEFPDIDLNIKTGIIDTFCVRPQFRGNGMAKFMCNGAITWLVRNGCKEILSRSWVSDHPQCSMPVFMRLGFREQLRMKRPYIKKCTADPTYCPRKKPGCDCVCDAVIMRFSV